MQEHLAFINQSGTKIAAVLHKPETGTVKAYAIFAHCFTCTKNINAATRIAKALTEEGIATLRFDFAGLGSSGGDFSETTFSSNVQDLIDAANFLKEEHPPPELLVGHSLGGTAVLAATRHIPSLRAVCTLGSPSTPEHVLHHLTHKMSDIEETGESDVQLAGRTFTFKKAFVDDARAYKVNIGKLETPLLVMHSAEDSTVSIDEAGKIYKQAKHPKSFVSLDGADHLLSQADDSRYASKVLATWASRYISSDDDEAGNAETQSANENVVISAKTNQGFLTTVNANGHKVLVDEPIKVGGSNLGPTPYDYLSVALGSCTTMTINMYARHKKIPLDKVSVEIGHHKIHADDCLDCESKDTKVDVFSRELSFEGDLTDAQRQRMLEIADKCPVHKTLHNEIKITTKLNETT